MPDFGTETLFVSFHIKLKQLHKQASKSYGKNKRNSKFIAIWNG